MVQEFPINYENTHQRPDNVDGGPFLDEIREDQERAQREARMKRAEEVANKDYEPPKSEAEKFEEAKKLADERQKEAEENAKKVNEQQDETPDEESDVEPPADPNEDPNEDPNVPPIFVDDPNKNSDENAH